MEVQIEEPPIRAAADKGEGRYDPGQPLTVILESVSVQDGRVEFRIGG